jgi:hypothetical protein
MGHGNFRDLHWRGHQQAYPSPYGFFWLLRRIPDDDKERSRAIGESRLTT